MKTIKLALAPSMYNKINKLSIGAEYTETIIANELLESKVYPIILELYKGNTKSIHIITAIAINYDVKKLKLHYYIIGMFGAEANAGRILKYMQKVVV